MASDNAEYGIMIDSDWVVSVAVGEDTPEDDGFGAEAQSSIDEILEDADVDLNEWASSDGVAAIAGEPSEDEDGTIVIGPVDAEGLEMLIEDLDEFVESMKESTSASKAKNGKSMASRMESVVGGSAASKKNGVEEDDGASSRRGAAAAKKQKPGHGGKAVDHALVMEIKKRMNGVAPALYEAISELDKYTNGKCSAKDVVEAMEKTHRIVRESRDLSATLD